MTAVEIPKLSATEYLAWERRQIDIRHEFVDGEVFAMTGASRAHNTIVRNLIQRLQNALEGSPCGAYANDFRVQQQADRRYVYPDVVVACKPLALLEDDTLLNPRLIVEVQSPSTAAYDRGDKLLYYRAMPSIDTIILIEQSRVLVEVYSRQGEHVWQVVEHLDMADTADIPKLGVQLPLSQIYRDVEFTS